MKRIKVVVLLSSLALLSLIAVQYLSIKTTFQYNKDVESISLQNKKIGQVYIVLNLLLDIETGGRGYLLTGIPKFLEPFNNAIKRLPEELSKLYPYLTPQEAANISQLTKVRVDHAIFVINKRKAGQKIPASDLEIGKAAMDKIRYAIAEILEHEKNSNVKNSTQQSAETIAVELVGGSLFSLLLVGLCIFYVISEFQKRQRTEKELQVSLATSEAITGDIDFGIIACDSTGNVIFSNKWVSSKISALKVIDDFFVSNSLIDYPLKQILLGDIDTITDVELNLNNQARIVNVTSSRFQINNESLGIVFSIIDVTDSSQKIASLVSSKQMADVASKAKSDFLAKMSHEIRTPLNAILGVGEILTLSKLDKEQEKCLEIFRRSALTLNNLVNDILDLSKIEAGKIDIVESPFSLTSLIGSCTSIMDFRASQKGLLFTVDIESEFDHFIGDEGRIRQIALNLLSNAIKFTEFGEVNFLIKCVNTGERKDLFFTVKDSGKGIAKENIDKLFSAYQQENSSISKDFGGTGLGLSLSKELARLMGGDIIVKSEFGKGSEFTFKISLMTAKGVFVEEKIDNNLKFSKLKVLLVDDNQENRFIVKKYLADYDIEIIEAVDGEDAVEKFKSSKYDIVFMDINMPKKDGLSATKDIRDYEQSKNISKTLIIALSANALSLEYTKAMTAGCDDYLTKPISRIKLISMIQKWVGKQTTTEVEEGAIDMSDENDEEIDADIQALIPMYLESRVKDLQVIRAAFTKKEMAIIAKLVHNMKGTALSYGQNELDKLAKGMETAIHENKMEEVESYIQKMETLLRVNNGN